jgi:hypothetical protein
LDQVGEAVAGKRGPPVGGRLGLLAVPLRLHGGVVRHPLRVGRGANGDFCDLAVGVRNLLGLLVALGRPVLELPASFQLLQR